MFVDFQLSGYVIVFYREYNISGERELIRENLEEIKLRIRDSALKSGRNPDEIITMAVSKTFPATAVMDAYNCGIRHFGENYMQEAIEKIESLPGISPCWHFIGHLQKNKVRQAVKYFSVIQSVDSLSLLKRIDLIAGEEEKRLRVLLQVNLVGEESKSGFDPADVKPAIESARTMKNIIISGFMLIPPFYDDPEKNRGNFRELKRMFDEVEKEGYCNWEGKYLSMGMTDDFEIAVEEGSNMLRIGRAIFGDRRRK